MNERVRLTRLTLFYPSLHPSSTKTTLTFLSRSTLFIIENRDTRDRYTLHVIHVVGTYTLHVIHGVGTYTLHVKHGVGTCTLHGIHGVGTYTSQGIHGVGTYTLHGIHGIGILYTGYTG